MLRWAGFIFLFFAIILIVFDLNDWRQTGELDIMALGARWYAVAPASLNLTQAIIERYIWPPLWDPVLATVLRWPAWALPLALGALMTFFGLRNPRDPVFGKIKRRR